MGVISFIESVCVQDVLYWAPSGNTGYGEALLSPEERKCRWDDIGEIYTRDDGVVISTKAKLLLTADVKVGGYMMLGSLSDLESSSQDPRELQEAFPIVSVIRTPLFRSTKEFVYETLLGEVG